MTSRTLRRVMLVLAGLAILLTIYLVYVHYSGAKPICSSKGGDTCLKVQTSVWSKVGGVPVSLIGLIGYIAIFFSLLAPDRDEIRVLTLGMTLFGVCFSGYLTYRELFTLHEICEECVTSAVLVTLLFIGAVWRFLATDQLATAAS
ncbi:MAG TPA: vitamin K epoxide reductase family protein [Solirubrobacteraceae bacterium]|nr:vitamin K epoxide reductase family protein [Solirubrobacteraceae bacterium]